MCVGHTATCFFIFFVFVPGFIVVNTIMDLAITAGLFDGTDHRPWCSSNLHFGGSFVQMVSSYDHDPIVICFREPGGFFFQNYSLGTAYKRSFGRVFVVGNDILH